MKWIPIIMVIIMAFFFSFILIKDWLKKRDKWPDSRKTRYEILLLNILLFPLILIIFLGFIIGQMIGEVIDAIEEDSSHESKS